jgi:hypothetical protein
MFNTRVYGENIYYTYLWGKDKFSEIQLCGGKGYFPSQVLENIISAGICALGNPTE